MTCFPDPTTFTDAVLASKLRQIVILDAARAAKGIEVTAGDLLENRATPSA